MILCVGIYVCVMLSLVQILFYRHWGVLTTFSQLQVIISPIISGKYPLR